MTEGNWPQEWFAAIAVAIGIALLHLIGFIRSRIRLRRSGLDATTGRFLRPPRGFGGSVFSWQITLLFLLFYLYVAGGWTAESTGIKRELSWPLAFAIGVLAYFVFIYSLDFLLRGMLLADRLHDANVRTLARLWPRHRADRTFLLTGVCLLNPITEELVFRGILVHQSAIVFESVLLAVLLGLLINIGNHVYQGLAPLAVHIPLYFVVVAIIFSPLGLIGAIGFHFAADAWPFISFRRSLAAYKERQRQRRRGLEPASAGPEHGTMQKRG